MPILYADTFPASSPILCHAELDSASGKTNVKGFRVKPGKTLSGKVLTVFVLNEHPHPLLVGARGVHRTQPVTIGGKFKT